MTLCITEEDAAAVCDTFAMARGRGFDEAASLALAVEALLARRGALGREEAAVEVMCALARGGFLKGVEVACRNDLSGGCSRCIRPERGG